MFDEKDLAAYRSVLPSDEVRSKILADLDRGINRKKTEKIILSRAFPLVAACLVLIVSVVFLSGTIQSSLILEPTESSATLVRSISLPPLTATADFKIPTQIIVTAGSLTVTDAETGEILGEGDHLRVHGNVVVCWHLENESDGELTLSCLGFKKSYEATENCIIRTK